ncbi:hypothetical protein B9G55_22795 [Saccharibacillus sp. O16]|nr:hypothetical protein B9G55_22795 [Saccharibacillus sp. O16]
MDAKWVTCLRVGGYGHALTKGKVYEAVAEGTHQFRITGDHNKRVWIDKSYFVTGKVEVPILSSWKFDDECENLDLIEVTITFSTGMKRWCLVTTPQRLVRHFADAQLDVPGFHIQHLIIVKTLNVEDVEHTLRHLDEQGEIEKATLLLK